MAAKLDIPTVTKTYLHDIEAEKEAITMILEQDWHPKNTDTSGEHKENGQESA